MCSAVHPHGAMGISGYLNPPGPPAVVVNGKEFDLLDKFGTVPKRSYWLGISMAALSVRRNTISNAWKAGKERLPLGLCFSGHPLGQDAMRCQRRQEGDGRHASGTEDA